MTMNRQFGLLSLEEPLIIAEMSGNHNQSLDRALAIVDAAAEAGVGALKIQTYTADTMTLDCKEGEFFIADPNNLWQGYSLYELYQKAYTPWEWHKPIFDRCREKGIIGFSTPFDETAVEFLETLNVPLYKIASFELTDLPLIRKVAATGKPIIMSIGMATLAEIEEAVETAENNGCRQIALLKCTSSYPAPPKTSHIRTIANLKETFACEVGLSDHTLGVGVAIAAVAMGAALIEKHFTLSRAEGGVDSAFSLEPAEMRQLVDETKRACEAMGEVHYGPLAEEMTSRNYRRSLYVAVDIKRGDRFTKENVRCIRPAFGLAPRHYDRVMGRTAKTDLAKGKALTWDDIN